MLFQCLNQVWPTDALFAEHVSAKINIRWMCKPGQDELAPFARLPAIVREMFSYPACPSSGIHLRIVSASMILRLVYQEKIIYSTIRGWPSIPGIPTNKRNVCIDVKKYSSWVMPNPFIMRHQIPSMHASNVFSPIARITINL